MTAYLGLVSGVDADTRTVQVLVQPQGILTRWIRCLSPFGLISPLPSVGDEVAVLAPGNRLADAVCIGWVPTAAQVAAAANHPLIASAAGGVPRQTDPSQDVSNAETSGVLSR